MKICPRCNQQVSDEVRFCPFCSQPFEQQTMEQSRFCTNCGSKLAAGYSVCPNCGNPIDGGMRYGMPAYTMSQGQRNNHKLIWGIVISILIIAVLASGWIILNIRKEEKEKQTRRRIEIEYYNNMASFYNEILQGATKAEEQSILILKVWQNTILKKEDPDTDMYTKTLNGKGEFLDDFNDSLAKLFSDDSFRMERSLILESQDKVDRYYKQLRNPPEKYSEAYEVARKLYASYTDLCSFSTNPTGTLSSATERYNTLDADCAKYLKELSLYSD